jgi:uncharacterized cupin superfamily protein
MKERNVAPRAVFGTIDSLRASAVDGGLRLGADAGQPRTAFTELFAVDAIEAGMWACTPGGWHIENRVDTEVVVILSGSARITDDGGSPRDVGEGDMFVLPKGWSGRWDIVEPVEKLYVIIP